MTWVHCMTDVKQSVRKLILNNKKLKVGTNDRAGYKMVKFK